jgi:SAM-dependent methyltransferase
MNEDEMLARAAQMGENWEKRAQSKARDFYVASHPGWSHKDVWAEQARIDVALIMSGLDPEEAKTWKVLEIGCGVGRLAPGLCSHMAGYDGFDIAPGMVEEAISRNQHVETARFFVSDGTQPPAEVQKEKYELVLAWAVFIHCPKDIIENNIRHGYELLAEGGQLRFQVRANIDNPEGLRSMEEAEQMHTQMTEIEALLSDERKIDGMDIASLVTEDYAGAQFEYAELGPWLEEITGGDVTLVRADLASIYGWITKPAQ